MIFNFVLLSQHLWSSFGEIEENATSYIWTFSVCVSSKTEKPEINCPDLVVACWDGRSASQMAERSSSE